MKLSSVRNFHKEIDPVAFAAGEERIRADAKSINSRKIRKFWNSNKHLRRSMSGKSASTMKDKRECSAQKAEQIRQPNVRRRWDTEISPMVWSALWEQDFEGERGKNRYHADKVNGRPLRNWSETRASWERITGKYCDASKIPDFDLPQFNEERLIRKRFDAEYKALRAKQDFHGTTDRILIELQEARLASKKFQAEVAVYFCLEFPPGRIALDFAAQKNTV